ncbi:MAG: Undecaprenyl-diphosphatase [uncultured Rubrobacteraceae bacterium]|uniref:Undecaprenyl-diphosphatase n=1 Tax=uncultured Rubrobacteraceae bacterium TaxID=349277 RepID=A0A6J4P448_9ACTN|nr:MAG: Undecaprenyl-diphosphatase [uncultured Rubrobacteraceae bacterium]
MQAIVLGVVQGLTEFLPVSSSGHLLLGQYFLGLDQDRFGLSFDVALHMGTLLAVVSYFWRDLLRIAFAFFRSFVHRDLANDPDQRMAYLIIASTVPAALIGFLFEGFFEETVRSPWVVVINFVVIGVLFIVGEVVGTRTRTASRLGFGEAVGIGFAQAAALVPGVSRSGATITLGLFLGLRREEAARFSFLMSVPIIAGAGGLEVGEVIVRGMDAAQALLFVVGFVTSAAVGYVTIRFLLNYLTNHSLRAFAFYRFGVAAVVAVLLLLGVGSF